jgi:GT2 family glycosyltransferase
VKKVYALMCVKNKKGVTLECIKCFQEQTYKNIEIWVVDDGSSDGLKEVLRKEYPEVHVVVGDGNLWFGGAMRKGLEEIKKVSRDDEYLLTLNNDIKVGKDFVSILINACDIDDKYVIGSIAKSLKTGKILYTVHKRVKGYITPRVQDIRDDISFDTDCLNTRGTLMKISAVSKIGNFSKLFPHYGSDFDFFYRIKKAGFKLGVCSKAFVFSLDDDMSLSQVIRAKKKWSIKDWYMLYFSRRSSSNLYSKTLLILLYTPFPQKIITLGINFFAPLYYFVNKVIL